MASVLGALILVALTLGALPLVAHAHDLSGPELEQKARAIGFGDSIRLGMEHIYTGYDHLLFLAGLAIAARGLRGILRPITSFTLAHSITLALAALGILAVPSRFVEPAIAASNLYVAFENVARPSPVGRTWLTFGFGLVHGFGFAGALAELGLRRDAFATTLAGFNLGVEAGQLSLVLLAIPLLALARRAAWFAPVAVPVASATIGFFGAYWLVERILVG
ncbi:HupE/UreJ family protein [Vulgatibacter incomptus]|uniref:Putative transmembrane protein n=1 Tax=Vulgatibacter incomptus TaxID=1391653 RepID=A0A0K1PAW6_9BACT|nr:HupE/UreJ family protein [Vulgatibacter incomptus]AKU90556.1 putative transmembrane protein [Vulgatibacter incomptus]